MQLKNKYRNIIIFSYIFLILCAVLLFISVWNHLSLNPGIQVGNGMYFLLFGIIILATLLFTLHLLEEHRFHMDEAHESIESLTETETSVEASIESYISPYDVDIDVIAENIVPRIDHKEAVGDYAERILRNIAKHFQVVQGVFYLKNVKKEKYEALSTFAYTSDSAPPAFKIGEGISGQVAKNKTILNLKRIPENYFVIQSGLGEGPPRNLLILPLLLNKETIGLIELATFQEIDGEAEWTLKNLAKIISNAIITKTKSAVQK